LIFSEQEILPQYLLLTVEGRHHNTNEQIENQEIPKNNEEHEEKGPRLGLIFSRLNIYGY
jgi:hypothetical protein